MITTNKPAPTMTQGAAREGYFGIKSKNAAHLFGILRGQLYSDKSMAILREYCTNAQDSHAEAGFPERPIEVKLPSLLDMTLTIRDYGTGLSEEDIFEVFASYGESTKRDTNNQVGMLGIGSKSAFSYVSSFTIVSRYDGERSMYEAYLDETGLGKISLMHRESTHEENGVEIQVAVGRREDIKSFADAAVRLFSVWKPRPVIHGCSDVVQALEQFDRGLEKNTVETGSNWTLFHNQAFYGYQAASHGYRSMNPISCVMGNVLYPVDASHLSFQNQSWLRNLHALLFHVPIGDVEPVASREGLEYSLYTVQALDRHLDAIRKEIADRLESNLQSASSLWDARCELNSVYRIVRNIGIVFKWRGQPLSVDPIKIPITALKVRTYDPATKTWRLSKDQNKQIFPNRNALIFVDRRDVAQNSRFDRIRQNYRLSENMVYIEFPCAKTAQDWSGKEDVAGAPIVYLSDLPYKRKAKFRRSSDGVKEKLLGEAFVYNHLSYAPVKSLAWDSVEVDMANDQGVYVAISGYVPQDLALSGEPSLNALHETCRFLKVLKCLPEKVYGFKKPVVGKLGPGWKPLAEYVSECLLEKLDDPEILMGLHHTFAQVVIPQSLFSLANSRDVLSDGVMRDLLCRIASLEDSSSTPAVINACQALACSVKGAGQEYKQKFDTLCAAKTRALYETAKERYPLFFLLQNHFLNQEKNVSSVLDYIRLVDGRE